jgi:excisionase family DNA binding protein
MDQRSYLTAQELAAWLKIKLPTVRRWQSEEDLPCLRVGRLVRYEADRVREWLERRAEERRNGSGIPPAAAGRP